MTASDDILEAIDGRLTRLREEIEALQAARRALSAQDRRTALQPTTRPPRQPDSQPDTPADSPVDGPLAARSSDPATSSPDPATSFPDPATSPSDPPRISADQTTSLATRPAARARRGGRARTQRAREVVPAGKLELLLSGTEDGLSAAALADLTNAGRDQVLTLLREMEATGRVRRIGQRRGTRWRAITDEERIAERAAQLANQTRAARAQAQTRT